MLPDLTAIPIGPENRACVPIPPTPGTPPFTPEVPPTVVTTQLLPECVSIRTVELLLSVTNRFPLLSTVSIVGYPNCAAPPVPSNVPDTPGVPAMVCELHVLPDNVNIRIV